MANWEEVLNEIASEQRRAQSSFDTVRHKYLAKLAEATGRNLIAYYSGWQSKPGISGTEIRDEDRDGFMRALHGLDTSKGLDLILHTPGGGIAATQSIITYLREKFGRNIRELYTYVTHWTQTRLWRIKSTGRIRVMSSIKRHMEDQEARYQEGLELCIEAGSLQECENHPGTYFEGDEPVESAYKLAAWKVKAGKVSGKQSDVTDSVKAAYDDNSGSCRCEECAEIFG